MADVVTFRPRADDLAVLEAVRRPGESTADVLRRSLRAAQILTEREEMQESSTQLLADPDDLAEMAAVQAEFTDLRVW